MRNIIDFLNEALESSVEIPDSKTIKFNFKGIIDAKETLEKLKQQADSKKIDITTDDSSASIKFVNSKSDDYTDIMDTLREYNKKANEGTKRNNDETYAQKLSALEKNFADAEGYLTLVPAEPEEETDKDDENKDKKESE